MSVGAEVVVLIKRKEAARRLGVSPHTLAMWAMDGRNLPVIRLGDGPRSHAYYRVSDIEAFIARSEQPAVET